MTAARDLSTSDALGILGGLAQPAANGKIDLPAQLSGVTYEYCSATSCTAIPLKNLDPRFGVFLLRLAEFLRGAFGITAIRHFGLYPGAYGQPSHNNGIAIDIGAFVDGSGTVYSVLNDWGSKPAKPGAYRLSPSDKGYEIFKAVYEFTGHEGDDKYGGALSTIGAEDTYIRHPDLQDRAAANLHKNHFHLQAGQKIQGPTPGPGSGGGGGGTTTIKPVPPPVQQAGLGGGFALLVLAAIGGALYYFNTQKSGSTVKALPPSPPAPQLPVNT